MQLLLSCQLPNVCGNCIQQLLNTAASISQGITPRKVQPTAAGCCHCHSCSQLQCAAVAVLLSVLHIPHVVVSPHCPPAHPTCTALRFASRSSSLKSARPNSTCRLPVLSRRYSTLPPLKSFTVCCTGKQQQQAAGRHMAVRVQAAAVASYQVSTLGPETAWLLQVCVKGDKRAAVSVQLCKHLVLSATG